MGRSLTQTGRVFPGQVTVCTVTNRKKTSDTKASIELKKDVALGDASPDAFTLSISDGTTVVASGQGSVFASNLEPGTYYVSETGPNGYSLQSLVCTGADTTPDDGLIVSAGDSVSCTFTNKRDTSQLTITKYVKGAYTGNPTFTFNIAGAGANKTVSFNPGQTQNFSLPTGTYTISETNLPEGWTLQNISNCGTVNLENRSVQVSLTAEGASCSFTNFKDKDDRMTEETKRFISRRVDNLLSHGPDRARMLRRLQDDQPPSMKDTGSIKDGPLKFSSTGVGAPSLQRSTMMMLGNTAFGQPSDGTNPYFANDDEPRDITNPNGDAPRGNTFFNAIAGQASQLGMAQSGFKFGTSLSQLREMAAEQEAAKQKSKLANAGLSFDGQRMANPFAVPRTGFDIWMEGHISRYSDDVGGVNRDGDFRILYVGADYLLAPGVLVGALVQIDDTSEDIKNNPQVAGERGKIDGTGWMAGPYVGVRLTDKLFFDARAAWGTSNNDIYLNDDSNGYRRGSFDTTRWLTSATLTGNERYGAWRISPQLGLAYGHEEYDTYRNSLNQTVEGGDASIGRFTGTIEVGYQFRTSYGTTIEPHASITGIYNFDSDDLVINGVMVQSDASRAKVEGGVIIMTPRGWGLRVAGNFDGIGGDDFHSYGGSLWLNIPLN